MTINLKCIFILTLFICTAVTANKTFAQGENSVLYVPLIGITAVPEPLALPNGQGEVEYHYAVKNFLNEVSLTDIHVSDDTCGSITFITGDDNQNSALDHNETWRYICKTNLVKTTNSIATVTGKAYNTTATHKAYATVVVGSNSPPPLISIINVTKVAYPLSLPKEGGQITFTYKVNNPGVIPLRNVLVSDNKCKAISGKLGDTNGNNLLDTNEVWFYTCTTILKQTTTNTVTVTAFANGLKAIGDATITVNVETNENETFPKFPNTGMINNPKLIFWAILVIVLSVLLLTLFIIKSKTVKRSKRK